MIWILLVIFQIKHFVADYPLQGKYMLGKFKDTGWILPLATHCAVHTMFTFAISVCIVSWQLALALGVFDFVVHFAMDRVKASPNLLGRFKPLTAEEYRFNAEGLNIQLKNGWKTDKTKAALAGNTYFWWSLGLDQMVHHLTDIAIIAVLVNYA